MQQNVAIVTGASGGIGQKITEKLATMGYAVAILYHENKEGALYAKEQALKLGAAKAEIYGLDLKDANAVKQTVEAIRKDLGKIAVLINNAGIAEQTLFQDITDEAWHNMLGVHVDGTFYMTRAVLSDMLDAQNGRIINISSMWGEVGASCEVHYSTAKAAIIGMTKALAKELAPSGITVNAVAPGAIRTKMLTDWGDEIQKELEAEIPMGRIGNPEEIAEAVGFLASDKAKYITGHVLSVNGGMVI